MPRSSSEALRAASSVLDQHRARSTAWLPGQWDLLRTHPLVRPSTVGRWSNVDPDDIGITTMSRVPEPDRGRRRCRLDGSSTSSGIRLGPSPGPTWRSRSAEHVAQRPRRPTSGSVPGRIVRRRPRRGGPICRCSARRVPGRCRRRSAQAPRSGSKGHRLALALEAGARRVTGGDDGAHPGLLAVMSAGRRCLGASTPSRPGPGSWSRPPRPALVETRAGPGGRRQTLRAARSTAPRRASCSCSTSHWPRSSPATAARTAHAWTHSRPRRPPAGSPSFRYARSDHAARSRRPGSPPRS